SPHPEFPALPLSGYFGELPKGGALAVCVLSVCTLFPGVKLTTRRTGGRSQKPDSDINSGRASHPYNK
ncbi:MAG: hypothetical protein WB819_13715, partial [Terriglobia bacterium]